MTPRLRAALRTAIALLATVLGPSAYGQSAAPTAAPPAATLTPPKLVTFVDATYPSAAKAAGLQAQVDLEMTIDATGKVTECGPSPAVGNGFDEAAVEAARSSSSSRPDAGERAIPARIKYRYVFELPPAAPPLPTTGELEGRVLARGRDRVVAGAVVTLVSADGQTTLTALTDPSGNFRFQALAPGRFRVKLAAAEPTALAADEEVAAGELTSVTYRMEASRAANEAGGARVRGHGDHRGPSTRGHQAQLQRRRAGADGRNARRSPEGDRVHARRRSIAAGRGHHHPRVVTRRLRGAVRGRPRLSPLSFRRADQLCAATPAGEDRPLPREFLGSLRPQDGRHHRRRDSRSEDRRAARAARRQPGRQLVPARRTNRPELVVRDRGQAQLLRSVHRQARPEGRGAAHGGARVLGLPGDAGLQAWQRRSLSRDGLWLVRRRQADPGSPVGQRTRLARRAGLEDRLPPRAAHLAAQVQRRRRAPDRRVGRTVRLRGERRART